MIRISITQEMIDEAKRLIPDTQVYRTIVSNIDTLTGNLGEFVFAQWFFGDWKKNTVGFSKGKTDFEDIEIKTSAFPFNNNLNLLVREDYAKKRKPKYYVQIIIDIPKTSVNTIEAGTQAFICGYATYKDVDHSPLKDFGSKFGGKGGYRCHYICVSDLKNIEKIKDE